MAFDLNTAKPVSKPGFDLQSAQPVLSPEEQEFQSKPLGRPQQALTEPLKALGSTILGEAAGGFTGAFTGLQQGSLEGQRERREMSQAVAEIGQPETQIGTRAMEGLEQVGQIVTEPLALGAGKAEELFGDPERAEQTAQEVRDQGLVPAIANRLLDAGLIDPETAGIMQIAPEVIGSLTAGGLVVRKGMKRRGAVEDQLKQRQTEPGTDLALRGETLPEKPGDLTDAELAEYKLTSTGKAVKDPTFKPLARRGFQPNRLTEYKATNDATKQAMLEMTEIKRRGMLSDNFGMLNRPADVVGRSLVPRINFIKAKNRQAGQAIKRAADDLKGETVDFTAGVDDFLDRLDEMGIETDVFRDADKFAEFRSGSKAQVLRKIRALYDDSDIDQLSGFQKPLTNVLLRMTRANNVDAFDLHKMKRYIDENVTYGKAQTGVSAKVSAALKDLRHDIDTVLDDNFDAYRKANDTYRETIVALDDFQDAMPSRVNLDMKNLDKAIGQELRKLESNYNARVPMLNAVGQLEDVAKRNGAKFNDDLLAQAKYMTDLDEIFGATGRNTFESRIGRAVDQAVSERSKVERVAEFVQNQLSPDDEKAFRMLREMLGESDFQ